MRILTVRQPWAWAIIHGRREPNPGHCSDWAEPDVHHLVLANPRPLPEPIPYRGALGLRTLDDETVARIEAAIE